METRCLPPAPREDASGSKKGSVAPKKQKQVRPRPQFGMTRREQVASGRREDRADLRTERGGGPNAREHPLHWANRACVRVREIVRTTRPGAWGSHVTVHSAAVRDPGATVPDGFRVKEFGLGLLATGQRKGGPCTKHGPPYFQSERVDVIRPCCLRPSPRRWHSRRPWSRHPWPHRPACPARRRRPRQDASSGIRPLARSRRGWGPSRRSR